MPNKKGGESMRSNIVSLLIVVLMFFSGCIFAATQWNASTVYATAGSQVEYEGHVYQNSWWTQGEIPNKSGEWGVWKVIDTPDTPPVPDPTPIPVPDPKPDPTSGNEWSADIVYAATGQIVTYQGINYTNKWWTQGEIIRLQIYLLKI
jgi:chitinase